MKKPELDLFLSKTFKKNFYNINYSTNLDLLEIISSLEKGSILSVKCFSTLEKEVEIILSQTAYQIVGRLLTYELNLDKSINLIRFKTDYVRFARHEDIKRLREIAKNNFFYDRFHVDDKIDKSLSDNFYANWIENSVNGITNHVYLYEENNIIMGFISFNRSNNEKDYSQIILNSVDTPYTQNGRFTNMLLNTISFLKNNDEKKLRIGTYEKMKAVQHVLEKNLFKLINKETIFHIHK